MIDMLERSGTHFYAIDPSRRCGHIEWTLKMYREADLKGTLKFNACANPGCEESKHDDPHSPSKVKREATYQAPKESAASNLTLADAVAQLKMAGLTR